MTDIKWGELKPANEKINRMLSKFRKKADDKGISPDKVTMFLSTLTHLITTNGREEELEGSLREKILEWKQVKKVV